MNRRSIFRFLASVPLAIPAALAVLKPSPSKAGFFTAPPRLTPEMRDEFKWRFIDPVDADGFNWPTVKLIKHAGGRYTIIAFTHPDSVELFSGQCK